MVVDLRSVGTDYLETEIRLSLENKLGFFLEVHLKLLVYSLSSQNEESQDQEKVRFMVLVVGKRNPKAVELGLDPTLRNSQRQKNLGYWLTGVLICSLLRVLKKNQKKLD